METLLLVTIPITLIFGILFWIQVFLVTMDKYYRFDNQLKLKISIQNATIMTIILIIVVEAALYFFFTQFIK